MRSLFTSGNGQAYNVACDIEPAYAFWPAIWPATVRMCVVVSITTACKNFELQFQSWNSSCYNKILVQREYNQHRLANWM